MEKRNLVKQLDALLGAMQGYTAGLESLVGDGNGTLWYRQLKPESSTAKVAQG